MLAYNRTHARRQGESTEVEALTKRVAEFRALVRSLKAKRYPSAFRIAAAEAQLAERIEMLEAAKKGESPSVIDGYNVEFLGARPPQAGEDY